MICADCDGTGIGFGTRCNVCGGSGELRRAYDDDIDGASALVGLEDDEQEDNDHDA